MKKIILLVFIIISLLLSTKTGAMNFYIAATGNDANAGTSPATAWKTIAKLNASFANISGGDSILFKCGDMFYGAVVLHKSGTAGKPIFISCYGNGSKPVITGFTILNNWVDKGNGVWQSPAPMVKSTVNLVTLNNIPQQVGRYPDADKAGGGYLTYESFLGNHSITDSQLVAEPNWTGAEICLKKEGYILERNKITSHKGNTITYTTLPTINPPNGKETAAVPSNPGFGYFIQRDSRTLSKFGEWYFDNASKAMQLYFGNHKPNSYSIKVSSIDTLVNIGSNQYISISNIAFEGANLAAIYSRDAGNITVKDCSIYCSGAKGIFIWNSPDVIIDNCNINYAACNAIDITGRYAPNAIIRNCSITNTAIIAGMGSFFDPADMKAIFLSVSKNALIEYNHIDTVGYCGIHFQGDSVVIQNNFINYHDFIVDDGGGIYTFTLINTGRIIRNNIILNGIGATSGNVNACHAEGIYSDGGARGIYIHHNTLAFNANRGIYLNDPKNISVYYNTCYSNGIGWGTNKHFNDSIFNFNLMNNVFYSVVDSQANFTYSNTGLNSKHVPVAGNIQEALQLLGDIDSNYYNTPKKDGWSWYYAQEEGGANTFVTPVDFETWKTYTGLDANSRRPARITANPRESKLIYNATKRKAAFYLDKKYVDVEGKEYRDSIVLDPYTSMVLIAASAPAAGSLVPLKKNTIPYKNIALLLLAIATGAYICYYYLVKKKKEKEDRSRHKHKVRVRVRKF